MPYDGKRVILKQNTEYSDYINASWLTAADDKFKMIAAQSPLPETIPQFLQMTHENKVAVIVTLTKDREQHDAQGIN